MRLLIYAGGLSPLLSLQTILREAHEADRAFLDARIAKRKADDIPLDDHTDWAKAKAKAKEMVEALDAFDGDAARASLMACGDLLKRPELKPMGEYVADPVRDDIKVRIVALEVGHRARLLDAVDTAAVAYDRADDDHIKSMVAMHDAAKAFLLASLAELHVGDDVIVGPTSADLDALNAAGLMWPVLRAVRGYQDLSQGKAERFGRPAQPT